VRKLPSLDISVAVSPLNHRLESQDILDNKLIPAFGDMSIKEITKQHVCLHEWWQVFQRIEPTDFILSGRNGGPMDQARMLRDHIQTGL